MTERIRQHIDNMFAAVRLIKDQSNFGRELALTLTHVQEASHLFRAVLRQLEKLGVQDKYGVPFERELSGGVGSLKRFLERELEELRTTSLATFEYGGSDKDIVLHLQAMFTQARIHVEQAVAWAYEHNVIQYKSLNNGEI